MLTMAVMFGVAAWIIERLAFAILLIWGWHKACEWYDDAATELDEWWNGPKVEILPPLSHAR